MKKEYYYVFFAISFALLGYLFTSQWVSALLIFLFIIFDCFFIVRKNEMENDIKKREREYLREFQYRYALLIDKDKANPQFIEDIKESLVGEYDEIDKEELHQVFIKEAIENKKESRKLAARFYVNYHVEALKEHFNVMEQKQKQENDRKRMIWSYISSICFMVGLRILLHPYYQKMLASSIFSFFIVIFIILIWISVHIVFFKKECLSYEKMESNDTEEE